MSSRIKERENAFIAAFELSFKVNELHEILEYSREFAHNLQVNEFGEKLITLMVDNETEINDLIQSKLKDWQLARLPRVNRIVLQLAVAEMLFGEDNMDSIIINQAVETVKKFAIDDSDYQFVNGVLGAISREIHKGQAENTESAEN